MPHSCPRPLRLDVLANAPYLAGLGRDEIAEIDRRTLVHGYTEGETIYRSDTPALGHSTYPDTAQAPTVSCALRISAADFREAPKQPR